MPDKQIIDQLVSLLNQGNAHVTFEKSVEDIPFEIAGMRPANLPYSIWMLVEHIRIAQADILDFSINENYKEIRWPQDYWPAEPTPENEEKWLDSLGQIKQDKTKFINHLTKPGTDLSTPFAHGTGQNLFRQALLIADHNSYHTGQIILVRRLLNNWSE